MRHDFWLDLEAAKFVSGGNTSRPVYVSILLSKRIGAVWIVSPFFRTMFVWNRRHRFVVVTMASWRDNVSAELCRGRGWQMFKGLNVSVCFAVFCEVPEWRQFHHAGDADDDHPHHKDQLQAVAGLWKHGPRLAEEAHDGRRLRRSLSQHLNWRHVSGWDKYFGSKLHIFEICLQWCAIKVSIIHTMVRVSRNVIFNIWNSWENL